MSRIHRWLLTLGPVLLVACSGAGGDDSATSGSNPVEVVGANGDTLRLDAPPQRVIALIPAASQILVELGVADRLVGRTDYDTLSILTDLPSVGGGIGPDLERLLSLDPGLVIRFEGPSDARTADRLSDLGVPHLGVRTDGIEDVRALIHTLGEVTGTQDRATALIDALDRGLAEVRERASALPSPSVAFLLGGSPPLAAGAGTFLHELIVLAGATNAFDDLGELYAPVSMETAVSRRIDVVLLTEGSEVDERLLEGRRVGRVPGWTQVPGPGLVAAAEAIARAIHGAHLDPPSP